MSFFSKNNTFHLKSNAKEIFDVSGAGDTVISVMAAGLAIDLSYREAAEFSNQGRNCGRSYWYYSNNKKRIIES